MLTYPLSAFRDRRMVLSEEELEDKLQEMDAAGKSCEVSAYGFSTWENMEPEPGSVMKDKVVLTGERSKLEDFARWKVKVGWGSTLIYDGKDYFLFVYQPYDEIGEVAGYFPEGVRVVEPTRRITIPGYTNLRTGHKSEIVLEMKGQ